MSSTKLELQIRRLQLKFKSDLAYDAMVGLFESLGFQITDRNSSELPNYPQVSSQPQYAGLSTSISQDRHPSAPVISSNPVTGPLSLPDSIPRATTSSGAEIRPTSSAPELCSVRPFTAPLSLSQMLPPKRDLPFPPKQKKVATSSSEMAPASFLVDSQEAARNPVAIDLNKISTATTNGANVLPFKTLANIAENPQNSVQPPGSTSALPDPDMIDVPRTPEVPQTVPEPGSTPTLPVKNAAKPRRKPASKPKKVIEPSTNPKPHPGSSKTLNKAPNVFEDVEPAEFMARLDGWVREYQHLPAPRPRAATSENLAAYAAQSKEERMMIIDDMICECLGDENFVKLAEDVGESWRRIGLGF